MVTFISAYFMATLCLYFSEPLKLKYSTMYNGELEVCKSMSGKNIFAPYTNTYREFSNFQENTYVPGNTVLPFQKYQHFLLVTYAGQCVFLTYRTKYLQKKCYLWTYSDLKKNLFLQIFNQLKTPLFGIMVSSTKKNL